jgi:hypothetical protein
MMVIVEKAFILCSNPVPTMSDYTELAQAVAAYRNYLNELTIPETESLTDASTRSDCTYTSEERVSAELQAAISKGHIRPLGRERREVTEDKKEPWPFGSKKG